ncbi:MAG TPA: hypothetical protein VGO68_03520 [Pyrinomonadaceae bacterium]|nr:hypothetical protein [Pyrinomonadaceae bacterium]
MCEEILELLGAKSRVSRLWLGPLHIKALIQSGRRTEAGERLAEYETLVSECQAPRCEREIERLKDLLA